MALRNLVAKMRNPVAAALRLPPPRAPARRKFHIFAKREEPYRLKIDIESASREELLREADSINDQIQQVWERVCKEKEKIPMVYEDMWYTAKLVIGFGVMGKVITYVTSEDDDYYEDDDTGEPEE